jgi:hypothetical protein
LFVENHFLSLTLLSTFLFLLECDVFYSFVHKNIYPLPLWLHEYQYHVTVILMIETLLLSLIKIKMILDDSAKMEELLKKSDNQKKDQKVEKSKKAKKKD